MESDLDSGNRSVHRLVILAEHYHELVYLAVSSQETETIYLDRATALLSEALSVDHQNTAALLLLLKCQVKDRKTTDAKKSANVLRSIGMSEETLAPWDAEICFLERDWGAFMEALQRIKASESLDPRLNGLIEFWMNQENLGEAIK